MAEPLIQVDDDWKKKAREEKQKLAEAAKAKSAKAPPAPAGPGGGGGATFDGGPAGEVELPPGDFSGLVRTLSSQTLLYLGMLRSAGQQMMDLDMAKRQIDMLAMLKEKTAGNLTDDERTTLQSALHEVRTRFVSVASQQII